MQKSRARSSLCCGLALFHGLVLHIGLPYLLVYKSTFYNQKINPKNRPRLNTRVINKDLTKLSKKISITIA